MNRLLKNYTRKWPILVVIFMLGTVGISLFCTKSVSASFAYLDSTYTVYRKWRSWNGWESKYDLLYWNTDPANAPVGWAMWADTATPKVHLDGDQCDGNSPDVDVAFNSNVTFNNCHSLTVTASGYDWWWFNRARLAFKIGDVDYSEEMTVEGGQINDHGASTKEPTNYAHYIQAYGGASGCDSPNNPSREDKCSVLTVFGHDYGWGDFKITLWGGGDEHEYYYDGLATGEFLSLVFNPNGGSVNDKWQSDGTYGDENALWSHKSDDQVDVLREYKYGNWADEYPIPTKSGYTFSGWYDAAGAGCNPISQYCGTAMYSDKTYTAHWQQDIITGITPMSSVSTTRTERADSTELPTFTHSVNVGDYSSTFTTNYRIRQKVYDENTTPESSEPTSDYTNIAIGTGSISITSNGTKIIGTDALSVTDTNIDIGHQICQYLTITSAGTATINSNPSRACVRIVARPYVKFFGADVNFCGGAGNVYTSARGTAGGNYFGSSVQYALFAYAKVNITGDTNPKHGFYSRSQSSVSSPKYLTFANTTDNTNSSSAFGGGFGTSSTNCVDYYNNETASNPTPITASDFTTGAMTINGQETRYVNGDAYINGNITYDSQNSWATPEAIPSYRLIVSGNIYIKGDVTKLDGFYFAKGKIYTCSTGSTYDPSTNPSYYSDCGQKLTVYGSLQANGGIKYWRTAGTLSQAPATESYNSANIAESIILSPEMYLSNWNIPTNPTTTTFSSSVDSIKNLPPIF